MESAPDIGMSASAELRKPDPHVIVLFGATGDLAKRKLIPGLFHLAGAGLLPDRFAIVATAQGDVPDEAFKASARAAVTEFGRMPADDVAWERFAESLSYVRSDELEGAVTRARDAVGGGARLLHYLSVPPGAMASIVEELGALGLAKGARVIMEKPFGTDLQSARELNAVVHSVFSEDQVFRIDHFLGKEAVQNVLALRFANGFFEPVWNRDHIDHIQIDVPETLSIGTRAGFYEKTGAFRDMVVTHLFQVLGFTGMEAPTSLTARALRAEKLKVFEALRPLGPGDVVRGQYEGYRGKDDVPANSQVETFVAVRAHVDNWRWTGVPFYLRTGKCLAESRRLITIVFRDPPTAMFPRDCGVEDQSQNHLTFDLGDPGSISLSFLARTPGPGMKVGHEHLQFSYAGTPEEAQALEAYERLIHDAMIGDPTLFTSADGIERLWEVADALVKDPPPVQSYEPGSWGPAAMDELIAPRRWILPSDDQ